MFSGSLRIGRVAGIDVHLHWSVLLIAALLGTGLSQPLGWPVALVGIVAFLLSILAHEFSHALVARRFDVSTRSIDLWALGGLARLDREPPTPRAEGWIAVAGPLASLAISLVALGSWFGLRQAGVVSPFVTMLGWLGFVNGILAVFNMLPGAPLDGGRVVKAIRWRMHGDRYRAARDAGRSGGVLGWGLAGLGLWMTINGQPGIFLVVTGVFIAVTARAEIISSNLAERLSGTTVDDVTWYGVAAAPGETDANSMLWERSRLGNAGAVVVTASDGTPEGVVLEEQLWARPESERPWVVLAQLMLPMTNIARAAPGDELAEVLPQVNPRRPVITVWDDDRLLGVVPPDTLRDRLRLAEGRP
jgi:Zn-dependent protease